MITDKDLEKLSEMVISVYNSRQRGIPLLGDNDFEILENKLLEKDPENKYFKIKELIPKLLKYRKSFYSGEQEISDDEFDDLESYLKDLDPESYYFDVVGSVETDTGCVEIKHNYPMLSIDSIKYPETPNKWYNRIRISDNEELIEMPKIDGNSCSLVYVDNIFKHATTRGNGSVGTIIPFGEEIAKVLRIPYPGVVEIRGELYIPKEFGKTVFKDSPLRNRAAGIIKSGEQTQYLRFIAYQILFPNIELVFNKESDILDTLKRLCFNTVPYWKINSKSDIKKAVELYITKQRDEFEYETDGIVLAVNNKKLQKEIDSKRIIRTHHYFNLAIKPPSKIVTSKLLDIEINVSKSGKLIPVMIYEPVMIDNVEFERATANNYDYLTSLGKAYVGNTVYIMRGNEVIPKIHRMNSDGNKKLPIIIPIHECPSCGSPLVKEEKHMVCKNLDCPGRNISVIYNWVEKRNMKNIGIKFLERAYEKGIIRSIPDLYKDTLEKEIGKMERFIPGGGSVNRIINAIEKSKESVTDLDILSSIGIPHIGRTILENINVTNIDTLLTDIIGKDKYHFNGIDISLDNYVIPDIAIYKYLVDWLLVPGNYATLIRLKKILNSTNCCIDKSAKTICITGTFDITRKELEKILKSKGFRVVDSVTKQTDYLLIGKDGEKHSKFQNAIKIGTVKLVTFNEICN